MHKRLLAVLLGTLGLATASAYAGVTAAEAEALGKDLTPMGAEKAGNADGSIPAWSGQPDKPAAGWEWGKPRYLFSKYKDEKPIVSIDAANVDKYAANLSPGQIATIKQIKGYRMDVYPSHRNCAINKSEEERTKANAVEAKLADNGWALAHAKAGGVPFPIPKNGVEAMYNAKLRLNGIGFHLKKGGSVISPRPGTNEFVFYDYVLYNYWPGSRKDKNYEDDGAVEFFQYYGYSNPPALAGQALLTTSYINKEAESYYYFPGQRRVRRLPTYTYDTPLIGFENQYTVDQQMLLWSVLDRFDYKLAGKKEIFIQHDSFRMHDFTAKKEDAYKRDFVAPEYRRYEKHRVWVVEATIKPGVRHVFPHRTYYLDEDTWNTVLVDEYDANGKIWKMRESSQMPVWELDSSQCSYGGNVIAYDLLGGRYLTDYTVLTQGSDIRWFSESKEPQFKPDYYTPETLRALSER